MHGLSVGNREGFAAMAAFMAEHEIHPVIGAEYEFAAAPAALAGIVSGAHIGKVVIDID